jgi:O-antigen/teichoic acid export membrane protein
MEMGGRVLSIFLIGLLSFGIAVFKIGKFFRFHAIKLSEVKKMIIFGLPILPHNLSLWFKNGFEKLLITKDYGLSANADYSFALTLCSVFVIVSGSFFNTLSPMVAKEFSAFSDLTVEGLKLAKRRIVFKVHIFLLIYFKILLIGYFISIPVVNFYFPQYKDALSYMPFLLGVNFLNCCYIAVSMIIYFTKKTKWFGIFSLTTSLLHVILLLVFTPIIGQLGVVFASLISATFTLVVFYYYSMSVFDMPWLQFKHFVSQLKRKN